ncbi:hypothetical protein D4764_12G0000700 [Takifugu flavidus]|uniref:Uncharacterized protein n=1 Tax=Takifugu flavidus TaxID=433684 RepID=A0A5C6PEQ9_9TELE|nr:hypothetical protein D4764_12G0000700 [Takifugu flavidus]
MEADFHRLAAQQTEEKSIPKAPSQEDVKREMKNEKKVSEKDEEEEQINISQTDSGESSNDDNFFTKLIKKQECLMLGKKEFKTNETKKEDLLLSNRSTKPKLPAQHQYEPIDSSRGGSSEKSEHVQVPRMEHETLMKTAKDKQAAEMKRTKAQLGQEMEQFKSELDFQIQEENKKLKEDLEESQRVNIQNWRKKYIADYKKKLADVLQEARVEMQQDHQKKVEMLRLDNLREINNIRQKYMDEESALRQSLLASMQEEREALQASHCEQLGSLRLQFDEQMEQMKLEHSQKVRGVHVSCARPVVV